MWELTYGQLKRCIKGYTEHKEEELQFGDELNHSLGVYISWAVNDAKHYPKEPFSRKAHNSATLTTDEALEAHIRAKAKAQAELEKDNGIKR